MRICIILITVMMMGLLPQAMSESDIQIGYQVTLAIPSDYSEGFLGRAFVMETQQRVPPHFRAAITVEAVDGKYSCSIDVLLGNVRVWSSGHLSRFHTAEKCVLEFSQDGDLRLKDQTGRVGWRSGTSGQGVERLSLLRTGNLVLVDAEDSIKWQSFNYPTDVILWGQRLSSQTRLTSFPAENWTMFYSLEIQDDHIGLYLNVGEWKYSYWEYRPSTRRNITFVQVSTYGLELFNGDHKFDQIRSTGNETVLFLAVDNSTGDLSLYHYSSEEGEFEASYRALNSTCNLPLACKPYGICTAAGSCSCIRTIVEKEGFQPDCGKGNFERLCGKRKAEMVELQGVVSVMRSDQGYKGNVSKEECGDSCLEDCGCLAAQYVEDGGNGRGRNSTCFVYGMVRGIKQVEMGENDRVRVRYMVKMGKGASDGVGKNSSGLKKWVTIVIVVVDGFIFFVVLGGLAYYFIRKRRKEFELRGTQTRN